MEKIIIDAENTPIGRVGSFAAKQSLGGKEIVIINSDKAIISGNKDATIKKFKSRRAKGGTALKGPYHSKDSEKILKRCIRGMLPDYRNGRGKEAWRRIKCYNKTPEEIKIEKVIKIKTKIPIKHITLHELKKVV